MVQGSSTTGGRLPIESLSPSAIEFLDLIRDSIDEGLSKRAIQQRIKDVKADRGQKPTGIKDAELTKARRLINGETDLSPASDLRFINKDKRIDVTRSDKSRGPLLRTFSHVVAIVDEASDEEVGFITISTDRELTINEIEAEAMKHIESQGIEVYAFLQPTEFFLRVVESIVASTSILGQAAA